MRFIADLVHEKKQLVEKAEAILNEAEKAGGSLTNEQERQFNRYTDKIKSINESIDEELLNIRTSEPILITPQKAVSPIEESKTPVTKAVSKSFRGMFYEVAYEKQESFGKNNGSCGIAGSVFCITVKHKSAIC